MTDLNEYVRRLESLKMSSLAEYNAAMENYRDNYPEFYNQLITAMKAKNVVSKEDNFKLFLNDYKWYLIAISVGIGVIIYLVFLLLTR